MILNNTLKLFVEDVKKEWYVRLETKQGKFRHASTLQGQENVKGSSSIAFQVSDNLSSIPLLLPVKEQIVKLKFDRMQKQCSNSFGFRHSFKKYTGEKKKGKLEDVDKLCVEDKSDTSLKDRSNIVWYEDIQKSYTKHPKEILNRNVSIIEEFNNSTRCSGALTLEKESLNEVTEESMSKI
ncbi:unnamed protein product [Lepeophtheirus salmonis]|uniref:(salmon louse) hypothetical protein n=1 Tax=Lepeophtheirus salmonis TaxID=72036 RepID=A0A7R8CAE8_LEPSM|nr:unnamed protein product [Lepeophtheirus salmonis]CAF2750409.1 unnamed protein product [Lepeophtheirus salmonis]